MTPVRTLILVPTERERRELRLEAPDASDPHVELCGFGPIAAAARTAQLLGRSLPDRALLVGIAGTFDEGALAIGAARRFGVVCLDDLGARNGPDLLGPRELGLPQWPLADPPIEDALDLDRGAPRSIRRESEAPALLTVCTASGDTDHAASRRARFPHAIAEDMEGFGVALACALHAVPLTVIRGASNRAGDRSMTRWRVRDALDAARLLCLDELAREGDSR